MKKKSSFYHIRWNTVGLNEERAAELIGVTIEEIKQWDMDGAPAMAERLLLLWDRKHIHLDGWTGWMFSRGVLVHGKQRWTANRILKLTEQETKISALETELERLNTWRGMWHLFSKKILSRN